MCAGKTSWNEVMITFAHVLIAATAVYATYRGFAEYELAVSARKSEEQRQKVLVVLNASERWRATINELTNPAIELVGAMKTKETRKYLYQGLEINLCSEQEREEGETEPSCIERKNVSEYGTLLDGSAIINKENSRNIRISLVKYLNLLENISEIYRRDFGDREYVYCNFLEHRIDQKFFGKLVGFMDAFSDTSWTVYRTLAKQGPKAQEITCPT